MILNNTGVLEKPTEKNTDMPDLSFMGKSSANVNQNPKIEKICFVCTGNTCRSPMAQALFNHLNKNKSIRAISAGVSAFGMPISKNSVSALRRYGAVSTPDNDYEHHISKMIDEKTVSECSKIIALTGDHAMTLMGRFPLYASKIYAMPRDICDPFGGSETVYQSCLSEIESCLIEIFPELGSAGNDK